MKILPISTSLIYINYCSLISTSIINLLMEFPGYSQVMRGNDFPFKNIETHFNI